jgi:phosphomannomutase/HD-GYP domain-containing protein (c-di-GMP phosphodiesterase class II)
MKKVRIDILCKVISQAIDVVEEEQLGATEHHSYRVSVLCAAMGRHLGFGDNILLALVVSALFHDSAITEHVLGELAGTNREENMLLHCIKGQEHIGCIPLEAVPDDFVLYHHELADGSGVFGLKEGEFPLEAELISLADSVDVLFSLKELTAADVERVRTFVAKRRGTKFSQTAANAFLAIFDEQMATSLNDENIRATMNRVVPHAYIALDDPAIIRIADLVARVIDYKSKFTRRHTNQIANRVYLMCQYYGYDSIETGLMYLAAGLHDLGKIKIPTEILEKPGKLSDDEFEIIKKHVYFTWEWLHDVEGFEDICTWASSHHEKLDGSGYPFGRNFDELDFNARLLAVIDIYQAVTEARPYHASRNHEQTMQILYSMADEEKIDLELVKDVDIVMAPWSQKEIPSPAIACDRKSSRPLAVGFAKSESAENDETDALLSKAATPPNIKFGTDGWRAIIGEDFDTLNLARLAEATARVYREDNPPSAPNTLLVGYDCRENAGRYAVLVATILASYGFDVQVSDSYCPTPALCWNVANNPAAVGGLMLTSSHNPAEYLGLKLRMADGGASPKAFSDRVEAALVGDLPAVYDRALDLAQQATNGTSGNLASILAFLSEPSFAYADFMTPYLNDLVSLVDAQAIAAANLRVVVDPMFGAGRFYLAQTLRHLGVEVVTVNSDNDPTFAGLHPEPILPWIQTGLDKVVELNYDACFITDGDADRIGAGDSDGNFVNPHRILALLCALLVEDKGQHGRVVRTLSGSNLIKRQCERLGLELTTTPIGFKWIYEQMLNGDVIIGGEESGGIGIPSHVRERDGLLMALLLTELMAKKGKSLGTLVRELLETLGNFDYARRDLRLTPDEKDAFLSAVIHARLEAAAYREHFAVADEQIVDIDYRDGIKFSFASDAWLLMRPSGTEPLVRVYAEATAASKVELLLDIGCSIVKGE